MREIHKEGLNLLEASLYRAAKTGLPANDAYEMVEVTMNHYSKSRGWTPNKMFKLIEQFDQKQRGFLAYSENYVSRYENYEPSAKYKEFMALATDKLN